MAIILIIFGILIVISFGLGVFLGFGGLLKDDDQTHK